MSSVRRTGKGLAGLSAGLKALPRTVAIEVSRSSAGELSTAARGSFDAGLTAYDEPRPLGSSGNELTLIKTGTVQELIRFVSDGTTKLRATLGVPYMRYLIRFGILPRGGQQLPGKWSRLFEAKAQQVIAEKVKAL